jgi:guanylate kinase
VLEIEVQGARQVRDSLGDDAVLIFIAPPDEDVLRERLEGRGTDSSEAIEQRLRTAEVELAARSEFPLEVVNDEVQKAASELEGLVRGELSLH